MAIAFGKQFCFTVFTFHIGLLFIITVIVECKTSQLFSTLFLEKNRQLQSVVIYIDL